MQQFDYDVAFSRNLGWVTPDEQTRISGTRVAIAGLGGVGGAHLLTHARLGISNFSIADFDCFEYGNFNRQAGALISTVGRNKLDVLHEMARDVNPDVDIRSFPEGVSQQNLDAFLENVDVLIDGLDFFVLDFRSALFDACRERGIPVVTVAPLGMSAALLVFLQDGVSFESYFRLRDADSEIEKALRFLVGLAPSMAHRTYLVWPDAVNLGDQKGPSTIMACQLCAGIAATETLKLILRRGTVRGAPWSLQFDAYRQKFVRCWRPGGNANPIQRLTLAIAKRMLDNKRGRAA